MIQLTPQMRILVAVQPADFRKGIDGLARIARVELASDPLSGCVFVFKNRAASALKFLVYDGQGFWLCHKRLSTGRFRYWPAPTGQQPAQALDAHQLQILIFGGDFTAARSLPAWRSVRAQASS